MAVGACVKLAVICIILPYCYGQQGSKGQKGEPGLPGSVGPLGDDGLPGVAGEQGNTGVQGPQGPPGPRGLTGRRGDRGEAGPPGKIAGLFWFGERGPEGDPGPVGPPGVVGPPGPPGAPGTPGRQGEEGVPGDDGIGGSDGPPGPPGERGVEGTRGAFYIHWGRHGNCSSFASPVYRGYAVHRNDSEFLCHYQDMDSSSDPSRDSDQAVFDDIPCTLCYQANSFETFTLPGRTSCPNGYALDYSGYYMTSSSQAADLVCVDWTDTEVVMAEMEGIIQLITVDGPTSGEGYISDRPMACAVCSKS